MPSFIQKILAGDTKAILDFYTKFSPRITRFVSSKLARTEDVEEIVNDVFLEAIDSLPLLQKEENIQAWLYKIAHNNIVDFYRKKKIKSVLFSQVPFLEFLAKEIHQPEFIYEKDKIRDTIESTLTRLSKKYQTILRLHYEESVSVKDIATKLDLPFKATESLLFRARQAFKKIYTSN